MRRVDESAGRSMRNGEVEDEQSRGVVKEEKEACSPVC